MHAHKLNLSQKEDLFLDKLVVICVDNDVGFTVGASVRLL